MADNANHATNEDSRLLDSSSSTAGDDDAAPVKWMCEYCTYANYPSAIKCVMCHGPKASLDIFRLNSKNLATCVAADATATHILDSEQHLRFPLNEDTVLEGDDEADEEEEEEEDDAPFANTSRKGLQLVSSPAATDPHPQPHQTADGGKWPCAVCTYLNWPIALRCTQCLTDRDKSSSPLLDARNTQEDLLTAAAEHLQRTLTLSDNGGGARRKQLSAARHSPHQPQNASHAMGASYGSVAKWQCQECTYENYPKSQKCSMCGTAKRTASHPAVVAAAKDTSANHSNLIICSSNTSATGGSVHNNNNINNNNTSSSGVSNSGSPTMTAAVGGADVECERQSVHSRNLNNNSLRRDSPESPTTTVTGGGVGVGVGDTNSLSRKKDNNNSEERQLLRKLRKHGDWRWLHACLGVVENNFAAVEEYLSCGGSPARALTQAEVSLLNRNSAFSPGFSLIHLAIRFQREDMLPMLLSHISAGTTGIKRVPSYVAPDLAADIRRQFLSQLRISRNGIHCHYVGEHATFALPSEIEELPVAVQEQLYEELLDKDAQKQLETPPPVVNWSLEITVRLGSRLVVLWNRSAGDCLLDSTMQATWGIFDRDNVLRRALADSLHQCAHLFYPRWKEYEMIQASLMHFQLDEAQWQSDWANLLALASQPGASLEALHIFALAHIFRRPIIVYGVKLVKSFRGEDIGLARFEGVYLPLLWEPSFCTRSPIALGYTRGHFSALVPTESYSSRLEASAADEEDVTFLPLMDCDMKLLPIHFINEMEMGREESLMRQWLDVCITEGGLMVAQQRLNRPLLVAQMTEEWLNYYRRLAQVFTAPFARRPQHQLTGYSSDGDTEED